MHKLVFYSTIVGVPACVNDAPSWTVLLWFTTDFRFYRHIVPHVYTFRRQLPLTRFITLPPPILFPLESPFLSNSKKFPFHFKKKEKESHRFHEPVKFFIGWRDRVVGGCWAGQWWTYERYDVLLSSSLARVFVLLRAPRAIELMGRAAAL